MAKETSTSSKATDQLPYLSNAEKAAAKRGE